MTITPQPSPSRARGEHTQPVSFYCTQPLRSRLACPEYVVPAQSRLPVWSDPRSKQAEFTFCPPPSPLPIPPTPSLSFPAKKIHSLIGHCGLRVSAFSSHDNVTRLQQQQFTTGTAITTTNTNSTVATASASAAAAAVAASTTSATIPTMSTTTYWNQLAALIATHLSLITDLSSVISIRQ